MPRTYWLTLLFLDAANYGGVRHAETAETMAVDAVERCLEGVDVEKLQRKEHRPIFRAFTEQWKREARTVKKKDTEEMLLNSYPVKITYMRSIKHVYVQHQ